MSVLEWINSTEQTMKKINAMLASIALAASPATFASGWGTTTTITGYYVYDNGEAYITTSSNENPDACSSSQYLHLSPGAPNFRSIWASVIAAQVSGQTVTLRYEGC